MKYNFGAGPGKLAKEVLEEASESIVNYNETGLSILEISHRSDIFIEILQETENLLRTLLGIPETHEVIFLQGGASTQFAMIPMNLLPSNGTAAYLDTGMWASKAIAEAKKFGSVRVIGSSAHADYSFLPKNVVIPSNMSYYHFTSNNTIYGTESLITPDEVLVPLVCDMSSDILSRKVDVSAYSLIYAGAQKTMGPAGLTVVILKKDILGKTGRNIPLIFDYRSHIDNKSMYNTPSVYAIYIAMLNFRWLKKIGGVGKIEELNIRKAQRLYQEIDDNPLFVGIARKEDRSRMNVVFKMLDEKLEKLFLTYASDNGVVGIQGHRSIGGFRASLYNAIDMEEVNVLVGLMREFGRLYG